MRNTSTVDDGLLLKISQVFLNRTETRLLKSKCLCARLKTEDTHTIELNDTQLTLLVNTVLNVRWNFVRGFAI